MLGLMVATIAVLAAAVVTLSPAITTVIVGTFAPWLVAFIAHSGAPVRLKQLVSGLLAVVIGVVVKNTTESGAAVFSWQTLTVAVLAYVIQQLTYTTLWKRLNLNSWRWLLPAFGIGKPRE